MSIRKQFASLLTGALILVTAIWSVPSQAQTVPDPCSIVDQDDGAPGLCCPVDSLCPNAVIGQGTL